jgi:GT2 family glycosyltransferase
MRYPPRVYTVVLNYVHTDDTIRCVSSVRGSSYRNQFLVVVDNGATPASTAALRAAMPAVPILSSRENLGYAGGNNIGIRYALDREADLVWVLNPDTIVSPDTLSHLVEVMCRIPDTGITGGRILSAHDGSTILFNGGSIDWDQGGRPFLPDMGKADADVPPGRLRAVEYITGASMLVRRGVFDAVGLIPERYFLYFEETDFNVRASRLGWRVLFEPRSRLSHFRRSWVGVASPTYVYYFLRNRLLFAQSFTDYPVDSVEEEVRETSARMRRKLQAAHPGSLAAFDEIVAWAIADGRSGREGPRTEIETIRWEPAGA